MGRGDYRDRRVIFKITRCGASLIMLCLSISTKPIRSYIKKETSRQRRAESLMGGAAN